MAGLQFSELEIQRLFGHEAAEDEEPDRLREYYFKSAVYEQVVTDLPVRILVGHKGIGKSALFQIAMREDRDKQKVAILIRPNDIADIATENQSFLKAIHLWTEGLLEIIARKAANAMGASVNNVSGKIARKGAQLVDLIAETLKDNHKLNLAPAKQALLAHFLSSRVITVYLDDLDRGWQGRREDVVRISALLNAVRDIASASRGIRFRISLRSDVYYLVRTSDESTDKIEGSVLWQKWTNHEIFALLVKRIETFFGRDADEAALLGQHQSVLARYLDPVVEPRFMGQGHWKNIPMYRVLMSLIRKRPRDLVKLCTLAARMTRESRDSLIRTSHFKAVFPDYSQGRIQDTINEFRSELPDIERLLLNMKPNKVERRAKTGYQYSTDALLKKIDNISESGDFVFKNGRRATNKDLASFLYKINFLTARKETSDGIVRSYFEENRYLSSEFADFGFAWEIHPAYRWALQPDDPEEIYRRLEVSIDAA
ncbi:MAG: hypothetical protein H6818_17985 [Phycisphaerales bacterium]|nr:hypothetical protein [Phycisphaerales bacterium]MCB9864849.1 hypothetical protein [Phycisphaerales bacterium]